MRQRHSSARRRHSGFCVAISSSGLNLAGLSAGHDSERSTRPSQRANDRRARSRPLAETGSTGDRNASMLVRSREDDAVETLSANVRLRNAGL